MSSWGWAPTLWGSPNKIGPKWRDALWNSGAENNAGSNDGPNPRNWNNPMSQRSVMGHLPLGLQWWTGAGKNRKPSAFGMGLQTGAAKFGDLLANPGGFGGNIAEAIAPRVAMENEMINRNTQGQLSQVGGAMARAGSGGGFGQALAASIQQAGARQSAQTVRTAQMDSAQLVREDADRLMATYQMLLDWYKPKGRGGSANSEAKAANRAQTTSSAIGAVGSIVSSLAAASDSRLKENIKPIKPVSWTWASSAIIAGKVPGTKVAEGLVAQDVEKVWPDAVSMHPDGYRMVDYQTVASRLAGIVNAFKPRGRASA